MPLKRHDASVFRYSAAVSDAALPVAALGSDLRLRRTWRCASRPRPMTAIALSLYCARMVLTMASLLGTSAMAAPARSTTGLVTTATAAEPDYEEEKSQFQRGSLMVYALPRLNAILSADSLRPVAGLPARVLQRANHAQDVEAMVLMGLTHERGYRLEQDYGLAMQWYRRASAHGSAEADFFLGLGFFRARACRRIRQRHAPSCNALPHTD